MPWTELCNQLPRGDAVRDTLIKTVSGTTPAQAKLLAFQDPDIAFFFYCREAVDLGAGQRFASGDALFFNGKLLDGYDSGPQGDIYERHAVAVAYVPSILETLQEQYQNQPRKVFLDELRHDTIKMIRDAADVSFNGAPAIDAVLFSINLNQKSTGTPQGTAWLVPDAPGPTMLRANVDFLMLMEDSTLVDYLHDKGIAFLLTGLNNHDMAGWSNFPPDEAGSLDAVQFALQCQRVLHQYRLDGIDIDDEFAAKTAPFYDGSLAMVSHDVHRFIKPATLTKALYVDNGYFSQSYDGTTLGSCLSWGWTMSYWLTPQEQLEPYQTLMENRRLLCGFQVNNYVPVQSDIQRMVRHGYGGVMVFGLGSPDYPGTDKLLIDLLTYWMG